MLSKVTVEMAGLWSMYRSATLRGSAFRTKIKEMGDEEPQLLAALAAVQLICLTNARIIGAASIPAPQQWLDLLGSADTEILIG